MWFLPSSMDPRGDRQDHAGWRPLGGRGGLGWARAERCARCEDRWPRRSPCRDAAIPSMRLVAVRTMPGSLRLNGPQSMDVASRSSVGLSTRSSAVRCTRTMRVEPDAFDCVPDLVPMPCPSRRPSRIRTMQACMLPVGTLSENVRFDGRGCPWSRCPPGPSNSTCWRLFVASTTRRPAAAGAGVSPGWPDRGRRAGRHGAGRVAPCRRRSPRWRYDVRRYQRRQGLPSAAR